MRAHTTALPAQVKNFDMLDADLDVTQGGDDLSLGATSDDEWAAASRGKGLAAAGPGSQSVAGGAFVGMDLLSADAPRRGACMLDCDVLGDAGRGWGIKCTGARGASRECAALHMVGIRLQRVAVYLLILLVVLVHQLHGRCDAPGGSDGVGPWLVLVWQRWWVPSVRRRHLRSVPAAHAVDGPRRTWAVRSAAQLVMAERRGLEEEEARRCRR